MLTIKTFTVNPLGENCYLLYNEYRQAAIIDCGAYESYECTEIAHYIETERLELQYVLLTHAHFDHIFGLPFLYRTYGVKPMMNQEDQIMYDHANEMCMSVFGARLKEQMPEHGEYLVEGQTIALGEDKLQVICTPGHTPGGVCFYDEAGKQLFSGDTLFYGSVGRTDFIGGNQMQEIHSICNKLLTLPDNVRVYPGHGPATTIGFERTNNCYLR